MTEIVPLSTAELLTRRIELEGHIADCCGMVNGSCRQAEALAEVEFLLGGES